MGYLNLKNRENILKLKRKISKLDDDIYFQSYKIDNLENIKYRIKPTSYIPRVSNGSAYKKYINNNKNNLSTDFLNLTKDVKLIIPIKPYANIYQFAKNSTEREWVALFNRVKKVFCKDDYYISTHGHGVPWLHVRVEKYPKYYHI